MIRCIFGNISKLNLPRLRHDVRANVTLHEQLNFTVIRLIDNDGDHGRTRSDKRGRIELTNNFALLVGLERQPLALAVFFAGLIPNQADFLQL